MIGLQSRQVTLSWQDTNPVVDNYIVTFADRTETSTRKSVVVTGLQPHTRYAFAAQARNEAGLSPFGSMSNISVMTPASRNHACITLVYSADVSCV